MESNTEQQSSKHKATVTTIELRQSNIPEPSEKPGFGGSGPVHFGDKNDYPAFIFDAYSNSSILQSIINGLVDYVAASGFATCNFPKQFANKRKETLLEIAQKCTLDYCIFGAFSVQVIRNIYKKIVEIYYCDVRRVRLSEDEEKVYYSKDWGKMQCQPVKYNRAWSDEDPYADTDEIYYFKNPKSRGIYGLPMWNSAMRDIQTSIEISNFHLSAILNNFTPSAIISFNDGEPDDESRKNIERQINEKFSGSNNAAKLMLAWASDKEHAVVVNRISEDNFDQRYNALAKSTTNNIFTAFRAQPVLFGLDPERTAFNSIEYEQSFKLFKKTVVAPVQSEIEAAFKALSPSQFDFKLAEFEIKFDPVPVQPAAGVPTNTPTA